ncbi:CvpA family protein [Novosphingobium sp.]|uniref:CvpA family protein n=1 Tax=Novosphingobium sp. TaxID=1874826 RepID=UPI003D0BCFC5
MSGFDYLVFLVVGLAAIMGFFRGFVEEVLALAAWCLAMMAVHYGHELLADLLTPYVHNDTGAAVLAFAILLAVPYFAMKLLARSVGSASRSSMLGPIDRVLGFGFGALKGFVVMVLAFSLLVLCYDVVWGAKGRPLWIREARTYPFLNAASEELLSMVAARRSDAVASGGDAGASDVSTEIEPTHAPRRHHRHPPADAE